MSAVETCADGLVLRLYIQPKASRDSIVGVHGDELKVAITAPPVDGRPMPTGEISRQTVPRRQKPVLIEKASWAAISKLKSSPHNRSRLRSRR
nr:Uncharacterised ACR, YggU family COG1872 [Klebsiella pneumoniae]